MTTENTRPKYRVIPPPQDSGLFRYMLSEETVQALRIHPDVVMEAPAGRGPKSTWTLSLREYRVNYRAVTRVVELTGEKGDYADAVRAGLVYRVDVRDEDRDAGFGVMKALMLVNAEAT